MIKLKWINENPGAAADERGYWRSLEGRFSISPRYRHTIYPDSYTVHDRLRDYKTSNDTVRECKAWATDRVTRELNTTP